MPVIDLTRFKPEFGNLRHIKASEKVGQLIRAKAALAVAIRESRTIKTWEKKINTLETEIRNLTR